MTINTPKFSHVPVLAKEALEYLNLSEGDFAIDATAGGGGHLRLLTMQVGGSGKIMAVDRDPRAHELDAAMGVVQENPSVVALHLSPFSEIKALLEENGHPKAKGLICDLGISSPQLDTPSRGFSFMRDGPIDMRMNPEVGISAYELMESLSEKDLADTIFEYGDERKSRQIASAIKKAWPIKNSTLELASIVNRAVRGKRGRTHKATRTFQALRMAVNEELKELHTLLADLPDLLCEKGRAVFISFHSLEDRAIKRAFLAGKNGHAPYKEKCFNILTKKPIPPNEAEISNNPRSRSAKLRAIEIAFK